jgi:hypothetical protein
MWWADALDGWAPPAARSCYPSQRIGALLLSLALCAAAGREHAPCAVCSQPRPWLGLPGRAPAPWVRVETGSHGQTSRL